jgi:hypothetical protein
MMTAEAYHVLKVAMITIAMLVAPFLVVVIAAWFRGSLAPPPGEHDPHSSLEDRGIGH